MLREVPRASERLGLMYATLHFCAAQWLSGQPMGVLISGGNLLLVDAVNGFIKAPPQYTKLLDNVRSSFVLYKVSRDW